MIAEFLVTFFLINCLRNVAYSSAFKHTKHCVLFLLSSIHAVGTCLETFLQIIYVMPFFSRLYDIADDAELQEKSKSDLVRVTNLVIDRCHQTLANYEAQSGIVFCSSVYFLLVVF